VRAPDTVRVVISDEELTALALAADPDQVVPDDAVPFRVDLDRDDSSLLPDWYMPAPDAGAIARPGWRRRVGVGLVATFVLINAAGLCSTYGSVVLA
jgi:hypothetical protein